MFCQLMEFMGALLSPFSSQEFFFLSMFLICMKSFLPGIQKLTNHCHREGVVLKIFYLTRIDQSSGKYVKQNEHIKLNLSG